MLLNFLSMIVPRIGQINLMEPPKLGLLETSYLQAITSWQVCVWYDQCSIMYAFLILIIVITENLWLVNSAVPFVILTSKSHHFMQYFQEWCPLMPICSCENSFPDQTKANGCMRSHASIGYRPGNVKMSTKRGLCCHKMIPNKICFYK